LNLPLVELCKKNPGNISFASAGGGSAQHLALEMFKLRTGIDALHVPYKGSGPALVDLIGGQVNDCSKVTRMCRPWTNQASLVLTLPPGMAWWARASCHKPWPSA
jgi:hypothetical protein